MKNKKNLETAGFIVSQAQLSLDLKMVSFDVQGTTAHVLMLNKASSDRYLPPSEAWKLETILEVIDYIVDKLYRHLKKSTTSVKVMVCIHLVKSVSLD